MNGWRGMPTYAGRPCLWRPRKRLVIMPKSGCSDLAVDVGSAFVGVFPVKSSIDPSLWADISWCSERTSEYLSACRARSGKSSQISIPATLVWMGEKGPRYSLGASGFMSQVSSWLGPPHIQNRMTEVSGAAELPAE